MQRAGIAAMVIALLLVLSACGGSTHRAAEPTVVPTSPPPSSSTTPRSSVRTTTSTVTTTSVAPPTTSTTSAPVATTAPPTPATSPPAPPASATPIAQAIVVSASGYGLSYATFSAFDETTAGWVRRFGPWTARIGRNGFAPAGAKREGDGRTPSGSYGFSFFFGINDNPGVSYEYRHITSSAIVWDDDPNSANYNEWIDTRNADAGMRPEPMKDAPFYNYGAVIAYNTSRTPGLGSAIFLHVSNGASTAGCVALPVDELLQVLRWLNPNEQPQIRMGVGVDSPS